MTYHLRTIVILCCLQFSFYASAQDTTGLSATILFPANDSFVKRSPLFKKLWGQNRRVEWATNLVVPVIDLASFYGGLTPHKVGGGNETKSLQLRSANGKEYALRSVNKSRTDVIPRGFEKTFVEDIIRDGVSQSHPYAAMALAAMQDAAGILHPEPILVYVPVQPALDTLNKRFGNDIYFLEQRPAGDWSEAKNFGNADKFLNTEDVLRELLADHTNQADQKAFAKARLFDMLIGDWDRHEGNWHWAVSTQASGKTFIPIPRDRDQAFYTHNGILIDKFLPMAGLSFMQNFDHKVKNITPLNKAAGNMDRFFTNKLTRQDWLDIAGELEANLTDDVIRKSINNLPSEIYSVSGPELVAKIISRRSQLKKFATAYYKVFAKEVQVVGSARKEYFKIESAEDGKLLVSVFDSASGGQGPGTALYKRLFTPGETREVRIFGIDGTDRFESATIGSGIRTRIIAGNSIDTFILVNGRTHIYDDHDNFFETRNARLHLADDSAIHRYEYEARKPAVNGLQPAISYNNKDRLFAGLRFAYQDNEWRRSGYAIKHELGLNYSFSQRASSAFYHGTKMIMKGKASLFLTGEYDAIRWTNFYGLGNETVGDDKMFKYYRMLGEEYLASIGLRIKIGQANLEIAPFYEQMNLRNDTGKYVFNHFKPQHPEVFLPNRYVGFRVGYDIMSLDNKIVPTKGITFNAFGRVVKNLQRNDFFQNYSLRTKVYVPLAGKFSLSIGVGGETILGNNEVLENAQLSQHAVIGGPQTLRGYRLERFWGKSAFYNSNELRFITNIRSYLLNAKIGFLAFFDDGRVWLPGENSDKLHTAYGGGLLLAPFNKLCLQVTYGISPEASLVQIRLTSSLN